MTIVLILAAGAQKRWEGHGIKQLADLDGESVLLRIVRQVKRHGYTPIVVTGNPDIRRACLDCCLSYTPIGCRWIMETILSTQALWTDQMIVLLGDVIYSHAAIETILTDPRPFQIYGDVGEIYGMRFTHEQEADLREISDDAEARQGGVERGRVWNLYRKLCGRDLDTHFHPYEDDPNFTYIRDYTGDIDTVEALEVFRRDVIAAGLFDDIRESVCACACSDCAYEAVAK